MRQQITGEKKATRRNGREAVEAIRRVLADLDRPYDIVLMDAHTQEIAHRRYTPKTEVPVTVGSWHLRRCGGRLRRRRAGPSARQALGRGGGTRSRR
jgi:hypothetical protein